MIRDPSDGSVREPVEHQLKPLEKQVYVDDKPILSTATSGLPAPAAKDADRHERSRKWLADYRAGKINPKSEEQP
jgi:hypothetical protein